MLRLNNNTNNEKGFILVITMLMLVVLTLIAISANRTTKIELQIAGNEKWSQESFYKADGGTEVGFLLVEENVSCPAGFSIPAGFDDNDANTFHNLYGIEIADSRFAYDELMINLPGSPATLDALPADNARSVRIRDMSETAYTDAGFPHNNLAILGQTELLPGSAIQMAAGYDGKGKGAAASGAIIAYDIHSQNIGLANSETVLRLEWIHLIGQEGGCNY